MRASRRTVLLLAAGLFAVVVNARLANTSSPSEEARRPQADLAWFMVGLRELCRSKDTRLQLSPAQARRILPELQALVDEGILPIEREVPREERRFTPDRTGSERAPSAEERRKMQERRQKEAERIEKALGKMEKVLRQAQIDYILNLEFDPEKYGLGVLQMRSDTRGFDRDGLEKWRKTMEEGRRRLVQLNREVLDLLKKLVK
ncbi:MAG: hypothetical protein GX493_11420 [Firmicutes bacterium]|nr:hypothetical protein [Bacillota bacterium]